jgi:4-amino-4-deoxychorismate lyase
MTGTRTLVDGEARRSIPADDRGLAYGDGLFETIAVRRGRPCLWRHHLARLALGGRRLGIAQPDRALLAAEVGRLIGSDPDGVLKLILTRGSGARGYRPPEPARPRRILSFTPGEQGASSGYNDGVRLTLCETRLGENPSLAGIKHLNRLEQVLARGEWSEPDIIDGVMCDARGNAVCGTMSNLFLWDGRKNIATPALDTCGVAGTVRSVVREQAQALGIDVREGALRPADLMRSQGLFISNAVLGVAPVARFQHAQFDLDRLPWALIERVRHLVFEPENFP